MIRNHAKTGVLAIGTCAALLFVMLSSSCKGKDSPDITQPVTPAVDTTTAISGWTLVWNDEFNGKDIDLSKWEFEVNGDGGGNNELQYYTAPPMNAYTDSGSLVILSMKEDYMGKQYTSARMRTKYKGDWTYGMVVVRAKLPSGKGMWPAIWMLPTDFAYGGWPKSGEIDIMEMLGHETNKVYGTIHYASSSGGHLQSGGNYVLPKGSFSSEFHTFSLIWDATGMDWYVDSIKYYSVDHATPFDKRFHMLLNVAVGGDWPGSPDKTTIFPQRMYVDYVRVYKKNY
jgi:beta-glucanase (GH16 family)